MSEIIIPEEECTFLMKRLSKLHKEIGDIPEEYLSGAACSHEVSTRFDVNRFFEVFDRIEIDKGYVLDYVYYKDDLGGEPFLYARKINSKPISSPRARWDGKGIFHHLEKLKFEKSALGYFQFVVFCGVVGKFYLNWHANYKDDELIFTPSQLNEIVDEISIIEESETVNLKHVRCITDKEYSLLKNIDTRPRVKIENDSAKVVLISFSNWEGFSYGHYSIKWPHYLIDIKYEKIVDYNCGYLF